MSADLDKLKAAIERFHSGTPPIFEGVRVPYSNWCNENIVKHLPELIDELERLREEVGCRTCKEGRHPKLLIDKTGTLASVSGLPGYDGHAVDDFHWYCADRGNPPPELLEAENARLREENSKLLTQVRRYCCDE